MDPITSTAAAGIRARMESLDLLANNLANSGTPGFKADREAYRLYIAGENSPEMAFSPVIESHVTDFSQGPLTVTANPGDIAISGDGFLAVDGPRGVLLTRNGKLHVTQDGKLVTPEGYEAATVEPRRIRLNPALPFEIGTDGAVTQDGSVAGHLRISEAMPGVTPTKQEAAYFRLDSNQLRNLSPERYQVRQGHLEGSNFSPAEASVKLIAVLRQFETLQRAMQLGGEMGRKTVEDVARVAP
ncbi:MAG TPA: flagellar hook basal-body protein [Paludibaculum sp.]